MAKADVSAERLRELLDYDPETGVFTWKKTNGNRRLAGSVAGGRQDSAGYLRGGIDGRVYFAHRLAWLHFHGEWPKGIIDHINGDRTDNRIANLRDVSQTVNLQNQRKARGRSGLMGASWVELRKKWTARIKIDKKVISLGSYQTAEEAHRVYMEAKRRLHIACAI
jgi:hypothetical protein